MYESDYLIIVIRFEFCFVLIQTKISTKECDERRIKKHKNKIAEKGNKQIKGLKMPLAEAQEKYIKTKSS